MPSALITPQKLHELIEHSPEKVVILDASYAIGAAGLAPETVFQQARIGQAQFFDIDAVADQSNPLPHMLPTPEEFSDAAGNLGISNDHQVIVYDQSGIAMAACRAWWMFHVFGHENVRVLDGGLPAWQTAGLQLEHSPPAATPTAQKFVAEYRDELVTSYDQMRQLVEEGSAHILDARPPERFAGLSPEPRPGLSAGHMPGAISVPAGSLINPDTRGMQLPTTTLERFKSLNLDSDSPIVTTCGSGVTACVVALALFENGYDNISVYDGSWTEWGQQELSSPIVKGFE